MHIKLKAKRGQSTVEYVLLVTAVMAVIIAFVSGNGQHGFQNQLNTTLSSATQEMQDESDQFSSSHPLTCSTTAGSTAPEVPVPIH